MRVAVLWSRLSGYMNSCLRLLASQPDVRLFVAHEEVADDAPFAHDQFAWMKNSYSFAGTAVVHELITRLKSFQPDLLLVSGWNSRAYRAACNIYRHKALRVLCMDNPWEGTPKQWLGIMTAPFFIKRLFDGAFVAGERQVEFARRLGFPQDMIWTGVLTADRAAFAAVYQRRLNSHQELPEAFLYVGRLSSEKGIENLARAYELYRRESNSPWPLIIVGTGPLQKRLAKIPGVQLTGFVQPSELPNLLSKAGCFVMPSDWDHWGIAIHEASAAGLPVISTSSCGASVHLVRDGYNGCVVAPRNAVQLASAMSRFTHLSSEQRAKMGDASYSLSLQYTPERWAHCVVEHGMEVLSCGIHPGPSTR